MTPESKLFLVTSMLEKIKGVSFDGKFINKLRTLSMAELIKVEEVLAKAKKLKVDVRKGF